jgi:hypothetical protein
MNLKPLTMGFGAVLLLVGLLGFVSPLVPDMKLLGIFQVDALHNVVHVVTGIGALLAANAGLKASKMFFQIFGVVYALVTILGFLTGMGLFVLIPVNMADNFLHLAISALSLYVGFGMKTAKA